MYNCFVIISLWCVYCVIEGNLVVKFSLEKFFLLFVGLLLNGLILVFIKDCSLWLDVNNFVDI